MPLPHIQLTLAWLSILASVWILVGLAREDLKRRRLPNVLVGVYAAFFLPYALGSGMGWVEFFLHLGVGLLAAVVAAALYARGYMGGGDVKMWGALLLWTGPKGAIAAIVIATLFGGLMSILGLVAQARLKANRRPRGRKVYLALTAARGIPYGTGLALAGLYQLWVAAAALAS